MILSLASLNTWLEIPLKKFLHATKIIAVLYINVYLNVGFLFGYKAKALGTEIATMEYTLVSEFFPFYESLYAKARDTKTVAIS